jgi:molecular chaperone GrpE (heat shock protein)
MEYSSGDFLYHNERGVGRVIRVIDAPEPELEIQFVGQPASVFTESLISRGASRLSPLGFHALAFLDPQRAADLVMNDPVEVIRITLEDFPGYKAKTDDLKEYLTLYVSKWDTWWEKTQPLLKESPHIDSSMSRLREYSLHHELLSRAEVLYRGFTRIRPFESQAAVYNQARRVLAESKEDPDLSKEHLEDVITYLQLLIASDQAPSGLRLDALFRLEDGKFLSKSQIAEDLNSILKQPFKLYTLEPYAQTRLTDILIATNKANDHVTLLAGAICANEAAAKRVVSWAEKQGRPGIISSLIIAAFTENLPGELQPDEYPSLKNRLVTSQKLLRCLARNEPSWQNILLAFHTLTASIARAKQAEILFLLPELAILAADIDQRFGPQQAQVRFESALSCLIDPAYPIQFILGIIEMVEKQKSLVELARTIENAFWESADQRQDDFLKSFVTQRAPDLLIRAASLVEAIRGFPQKTIGKQAAKILCDLARGAEKDTLIQMLPYLDQLYWMDSAKEWASMLEPLREKAFSTLLSDASGDSSSSSMYPIRGDQALTAAVSEYIESQMQRTKQEIRAQVEIVSNLKATIQTMQVQLDEKEKILSELRGSVGGDTTQAKYEERVRILKEIATSVAEFERVLAVPGRGTPDLEALIRRLSNLLKVNNVAALGAPGEQIRFDTKYCHLTGNPGEIAGETVMVVERGYGIQDVKGSWRVLKYAQVRNIA